MASATESAERPTRSPTPSASPPPPTSPVQQTTTATTDSTLTTTTEIGECRPKKLIRKKRRPARVQVDPSTVKSEPPPQTGTIFNIWYNKWSGGDREDKYLSKTAATSRCNIARDSGYTRADKVPGSYFCLFFARGLCPKGHECQYLHRLPGIHDLFNPNVDCFGRDKHSDYRDDMGGVGSFMRQNRTLYVGRIHVTDDIEEVVARHFQEWGQIERSTSVASLIHSPPFPAFPTFGGGGSSSYNNDLSRRANPIRSRLWLTYAFTVRVLTSRGVAFITYLNEANSQFAKEAMAHQALDHSEILNVRWATVDPNPLAQKREAHRIEEQAAEAVRRALPAEFVAEIEGRDPEARKRKKIEGGFGLQGYEAPDAVWYARSREEEELRQLEGPEGRFMIEDGDGSTEAMESAGNFQRGTTDGGDGGDGGGGGGILSSSTLAALKGYGVVAGSEQGGAAFSSRAPAAKPMGPLVAYGSDDESD
ncbi:MAG: Pre-mRNA-splicing factor [Sarea resinae]|nr:MAG: Pre-mRNA-splicing factor [Sarea resinae]